MGENPGRGVSAWTALGLPYEEPPRPPADRSDASLRSKYQGIPVILRTLDDIAASQSEQELARVRGRDFAMYDPTTQEDLFKANDARWWALNTGGLDLGDEQYSPYLPGAHAFIVGPDPIGGGFVPVQGQVDYDPAQDALRRDTVPGLPATTPVVDGGLYRVTEPYFGNTVGHVMTTVAPDGMTTTNTTTPDHWFYNGKIVNRLTFDEDGQAFVTTYGFGNNVNPLMDVANQVAGPRIFSDMHDDMRSYLEQRRRGER